MNETLDTAVLRDGSPAGSAGPAGLPRQIRLLRNARLADGSRVDVRLDGDRVSEVAPVGALTPRDRGAEVDLHADADAHFAAAALDRDVDLDSDSAATLDLEGWLLLTAPAEPHAHLDKALSFDLINPPLGNLADAVDAWRAYAATMALEEIAARAREQALAMLAHGITAIRSHVDVNAGVATRCAEAVLQVREELEDLVDIQLVALASSFASEAEIAAVLDLGVELVGGAPHMAEDPGGEVGRLVAIAAARGLGMDLHTDENLDGPLTLPHYLQLVAELRGGESAGPQPRYAASHCCRLGTLNQLDLHEIAAGLRAVDMGVISLPITNLYLQGWEHPVSTPRGLPPLRNLIDAGVAVCAGADNVRDPFNPVGRSDAFETASLLISTAHLSPAEAWHLVSDGARAVMGLPTAGPRPGARAELLAVRAENLTQAVAEGAADRLVIHRGRLVARSETRVRIADPANPVAPANPRRPANAARPANADTDPATPTPVPALSATRTGAR